MRGLLIFLILILQIKAFAAENARPQISVQAADRIEVAAGQPVVLADLGQSAETSSANRQLADHLVILDAMKDSEEKTFSTPELVKILKQKISETDALASMNWTYFVPEKIRVVARQNRLSENRVNREIQDALSERCPVCSFKLRNMRYPLIKESKAMTSFSLDTGSLKIAGGLLLPVNVEFEGGAHAVYYVTGIVAARSKALVATRTLMMGEKIDAGKDAKEEEVEINFANDALAEKADLDYMAAAHSLTAGHVIYRADLKKEVVVQRGNLVRAISGDDTFEVSAQMQAEEGGSIGDLIKIKNVETNRFLSAKIVDRGVVRVQ
jgi:flagella basal body P-ring formation protein FlgA